MTHGYVYVWSNLIFSCPQIVWFISHSSHHYEAFYYSFQWSRFNLLGHEQAAWLQLLFLIKGIGSGIIWSSPLNSWLRVARPGCETFWVCTLPPLLRTKCNLPAIKNGPAVYRSTVPPHSTRPSASLDSDGHGRPRPGHNRQAKVKLSGDGKPVVFAGRIPMAFQRGWRRLSQIDLSGTFTFNPNELNVCQRESESEVREWQTFVLVQWWENGGSGLDNFNLNFSRQ